MTLSPTEKKLVWALVIIAVLGVAYDIFSGSSSATAPTPSATATAPVGQDILALVEKLKVISIDPSIFSSNLFSSLKDSETPLQPEVQGRADPFSLIGVDAPFQTTIAEPITQTGAMQNTQAPSPVTQVVSPDTTATTTTQ